METTNCSIKCRKCGGPHLTIKCGKEVLVEKKDEIINEDNNEKRDYEKRDYEKRDYEKRDYEKRDYEKRDYEKRDYEKRDYEKRDYEKRDYEKRDYKDCKVRIANLPVDMTKGELYNLLEEWGHIKSLFIKENYDSTSAFVEFSNSEQSKYFVEALNETPFEFRIITAEVMTN